MSANFDLPSDLSNLDPLQNAFPTPTFSVVPINKDPKGQNIIAPLDLAPLAHDQYLPTSEISILDGFRNGPSISARSQSAVLNRSDEITGFSRGTPFLNTDTLSSISKKELVFIDTNVPDYQSLVADIKPSAEVFLLQGDRDGITQITDVLKGRSGITSTQILSHGNPGEILLGNTSLSQSNLADYADQLQSWSAVLSNDADILLFGCDIASGETGDKFINQISTLTGADVAASIDLTGSSALGGDWVLEDRTGAIESDLAISAASQAAYSSLLPISVTGFNFSSGYDLTGFMASPGKFNLLNSLNEVALRRVDNEVVNDGSTTNSTVSGRNIIWQLSTASSPTFTEEVALLGSDISFGTDNLFTNQGDGNNNNNNIERVDVINNVGGIVAPSSGLNNIGFLLVDRGAGNDAFKIAAITSDPTTTLATAFSYATTLPIGVAANASEISGSSLTYTIYNDMTGGLAYLPSPNNSLTQGLNGVFVSFQDLGITPGQTFYGYSLVGNDVAGSISDYTNSTIFPTTTANANGGLDLAATGGIFILENLPPTALNDIATTASGTPATISVLTNDTDPNDDPLTISSIAPGSNGTTSINTNGTPSTTDDVVVYTPNPGFTGNDTFSYVITDGMGASDTATVVVTVNNGTDAIDDSATTSSGTPATISVLTNDMDRESDPLTITSVAPGMNGTTSINTNGTPSTTDDVVVYTPNAGFTGNDTFSYVITDGMGASDTATVVVTVNNGTNAIDDSATTSSGTPATISVLTNDMDPESDPLTITGVAPGMNGTTSINTNGTPSTTDDVVVYTPNAGFTGNDTFSYVITDGMGASDTATVVVTVNNGTDAIDDSATTSSGTPATISVLTNDMDPESDPLTITSVAPGMNGTTSINTNGTPSTTDDVVVYTPNAGFTGNDTFSYVITDGMGGSDTATVIVTVNNGIPDAIDDLATTSSGTPATISILTNDTDPDSDPLTITSVGTAMNGTTSINTDGTPSTTDDVVVYTPNAGFTGNDTFSYVITDGMGGSDTATVVVTVNNGIPDAIDDLATTASGTPATISVLTNDMDPNSDPLTITSVAPAMNGTTSINTNGTPSTTDDVVVYTPNAGFTGNDTFSYVITDGMGGSDTATVVVTVNNGIPDAIDDLATTSSGTPATISILTNDTDPDSDPLTIASVGTAMNGTTSINTNGTPSTTDDVVVYTPNAGFTGNDTFSYVITDGMGGSDTATVVVTVNNGTDAIDDSATTSSGTPATISVLTNDMDPESDPLTITTVAPGMNGTTSINTNGTPSTTDDVVVYTPNAGFTGNDTFSYVITDGMGASDTATVVVTVNNGTNAIDDSATTSSGTPATISVLTNDMDPESDPLTITSVAPGMNGTTSINTNGTPSTTDDVVVYTPNAGFTGNDTFSYVITDGMGASDTATVVVTVNNGTDAIDDSATTSSGTPATISVLTNDMDPESDPLTITGVAPGMNGTTSINTNGTPSTTDDVVVYTPNAGFTGNDTFSYVITDGMGASDTATVVVTVNNGTDAIADSATTSSGTPATISVLTNDMDPESDPLTITSVAPGMNGTTSINTNGTPSTTDDVVVYTPNAGFTGNDTFSYVITDGMGGSDTATVVVTVNNGTDAIDDSATTSSGTPATISVLTNDMDPESDPLTITSVAPGMNGTTSINTNGTPSTTDDVVVYTPNTGFTGNDTFSYVITDGMGGSDTATVVVTVGSAITNRPPDAVNDNSSTMINLPVSISAISNDMDPDPGDIITITSIGSPGNGIATLDTMGTPSPTDDVIVYTPNTGFMGTDSFTYTISDGMGGSDTATVTVGVGVSTGGGDGIDPTPTPTPRPSNFPPLQPGGGGSGGSGGGGDENPSPQPDQNVVGLDTLDILNVDQTVQDRPGTGRNTIEDFFDENYYLANNPDVAAAIGRGEFANALDQFERVGKFEGRNPSIYFDEKVYLDYNPGVAAAIARGEFPTAFDEFILEGQFEKRDPRLLLFDSQWYLFKNPDVKAAVANGSVKDAFTHYQETGQFENRAASILFDPAVYAQLNPSAAEAVRSGQSASLFQHYISVGLPQGLTASVMFNDKDYLTLYPDVSEAIARGQFRSGAEHFLSLGQYQNRQPQLMIFNEGYYLENNPDVKAAVDAGIYKDGLEQFVLLGQYQNRDPGLLFDTEFYLATYPDVAPAIASGQVRSAYDHYRTIGREEGRLHVSPDRIVSQGLFSSTFVDDALSSTRDEFNTDPGRFAS